MTYRWHWHCLLGRNISRTTANNVHIICICPDNVWMTCTYSDNMWTMSRCDMQRDNHQYRLSHKSFIWSWNETTQHPCDKFYSITRSCQSRKIVQVHADHEECCRWCADDMCVCGQCAGVDDMCRWHADAVGMWMTCGRHVCADDVHVTPGVVLHEIRQLRQEERSHLEQLCIKPTGLLVRFGFQLPPPLLRWSYHGFF